MYAVTFYAAVALVSFTAALASGLPAGATCTQNSQCVSQHCAQGVCKLPNGATCYSYKNCLSNVCYLLDGCTKSPCPGVCGCTAECALSPTCLGGCAAPNVCIDPHSARPFCGVLKSLGDTCVYDQSCISGLCLHGVCASRRKPNSPCTAADQCVPGSQCINYKCTCMPCVQGPLCPAGCAPPLACLETENDYESYCGVSNVPLLGGCDTDYNCASGFCDRGQCAPKKGANANCTANIECASGVCSPQLFGPNAHRRCECTDGPFDQRTNRGGCVAPKYCQRQHSPSGYTYRYCAKPKKLIGAYCEADAACATGNCQNRTCAAKRPAAAPCSASSECASKSCWLWPQQPAVCECDTTAAANGPGGCGAPAVCVHRNYPHANTCGVQKPLGATCADDTSCRSYHCTNGLCAAPRAVGASCSTDTGCASNRCYGGKCSCDSGCVFDAKTCPGGCPAGQTCVDGKRCVILQPPGGPCSSSADCKSGAYCKAGKCAAKLANGSPCTSSDSCQRACVGGKCVPYICDTCVPPEVCHVNDFQPPRCGLPQLGGAYCINPEECVSGVCDDQIFPGVCVGPGKYHAPCKQSRDCASGVCANGLCTCHVRDYSDRSVAAPCPSPQTCVTRYNNSQPLPVCVTLASVGQKCAGDAFCQSNRCYDGVCAAPLPNGATCVSSTPWHCLSGSCSGACDCAYDCVRSASCPAGCAAGETCVYAGAEYGGGGFRRCVRLQPLNGPCEVDYVCGSNAYCNHGTCAALLGAGANCNRKAMCRFAFECNKGRCG